MAAFARPETAAAVITGSRYGSSGTVLLTPAQIPPLSGSIYFLFVLPLLTVLLNCAAFQVGDPDSHLVLGCRTEVGTRGHRNAQLVLPHGSLGHPRCEDHRHPHHEAGGR